MSGWIKLYRNLKHWEWYEDHNATRLLVHLLVSVNYEPKKWKGITIQAGSLVYSWETLSIAVGLSVRQCRIAMGKLEKSGEVTRNATNRFQVVTLLKWDKLQAEDKQMTANAAGRRQAKDKQMTTTKEGKEIKEIKKQEKRETRKFSPPTIEDVEKYFLEKNCINYKAEAQKFWYYYDANGWKVGKNNMKKWKSAASGWLSRLENFKNLNNGNTKNKPGQALENWVNS